MKKYKSRLTRVLATILFLGLITMVIIQSMQINILSNLLTHERQARAWDTKLIYACYNYDIHLCDDAGVASWNEQNPDKAITESYLRNIE